MRVVTLLVAQAQSSATKKERNDLRVAGTGLALICHLRTVQARNSFVGFRNEFLESKWEKITVQACFFQRVRTFAL